MINDNFTRRIPRRRIPRRRRIARRRARRWRRWRWGLRPGGLIGFMIVFTILMLILIFTWPIFLVGIPPPVVRFWVIMFWTIFIIVNIAIILILIIGYTSKRSGTPDTSNTETVPSKDKEPTSNKNEIDEKNIFCIHCGSPIQANSKFCSKCGKKQ
ncbi:MAG: zinc ribbon domain-containing protein [Candidatus Helarchaeota archaeon]